MPIRTGVAVILTVSLAPTLSSSCYASDGLRACGKRRGAEVEVRFAGPARMRARTHSRTCGSLGLLDFRPTGPSSLRRGHANDLAKIRRPIDTATRNPPQ